MDKYEISDIKIMKECGVLSQIEIIPNINKGFTISFLTIDKKRINLKTQRGQLRFFKTLDSAFSTINKLGLVDCKLLVVNKDF
ncbi:TPA: hypothetical protein ACKRGL_003539 [Proteus mirabilis]